MAGETSKKSGEIGEAIAIKLLELIGWRQSIQNVSVGCNNSRHKSETGGKRHSHGDDQIHLYNSPFYDNHTEMIHVSVKNSIGSHPAEGTLREKLKSHIHDLNELIDCAQYDPKIKKLISNFQPKGLVNHIGLLVWLYNDEKNIECNIKPFLAKAQIDGEYKYPVFLIDNERASFIIKVVDHLDIIKKDGITQFFYPQLGVNIQADENRFGDKLPIQLICSDIIPCLIRRENKTELLLYTNDPFNEANYIRMMAYGLQFAGGLVLDIYLGFPDYNVGKHEEVANMAREIFHERKENIFPFSFNRSILSLIL